MSKDWTIERVGVRRYKKVEGTDSVAITHTRTRTIYLSPAGLNLPTVTHELFHAYYAETHAPYADLTGDAVEEICAEIFAHRGKEILDLAESLYAKLKGKTK